MCLQILSPNSIAFSYIIYRVKFYRARKEFLHALYFVASRNREMSSCASATACYLHLGGSATIGWCCVFLTTVTFSRSHRGCDSLADGFRTRSLSTCSVNGSCWRETWRTSRETSEGVVKNYDIEYIYYKYIYIIFMRAREFLQRCRVEIFLVSFCVRPLAKGDHQSIPVDYSYRFLARHSSLQGWTHHRERKKEIESQRKRGRLIYEA